MKSVKLVRLVRPLVTACLIVWLSSMVVTTLSKSPMKKRSPEELIVRRLDTWPSLVFDRQPDLGQAQSRVKVIEFVDYQCPFCRVEEPILRKMVTKYNGQISVYRYEFPEERIHRYAKAAAIAAECAVRQHKGAEYQAELFEKQANFADQDWTTLATRAGIRDRQEFASCISSAPASQKVSNDQMIGDRLQVHATPTLMINGNIVVGSVTFEELEELFKTVDKH